MPSIFETYGIDPEEWAEALKDAVVEGGGDEAEARNILTEHQKKFGFEDPGWTLRRKK